MQQIYAVILPNCLEGKPYLYAVVHIYMRFNVLLLAVEDSTKKRVIISPLNYQIKKGDMGVLVAPDRFSAEAVSDMDVIQSADSSKYLTLSRESFLQPAEKDLIHSTFVMNVSANFLVVNEMYRSESSTNSSWESLYNIQSEPVPLKDVTITHVTFQHHIILCGSLTGISEFVLRLRSKRLRHVKKVLILHPTPPDDDLWESLGSFTGTTKL
jgi:hypothetical protein